MTMFPVIRYPDKTPKWGLDPSQQSEPPESDKIRGHDLAEASPAYWENWRTNKVYEWCQKIAATPLMNYKEGSQIFGLSSDNVIAIFNPDIGLWCIAKDDATVFRSAAGEIDGNLWTTSTALAAAPSGFAHGIDSQYYIIGDNSSNLNYSVNAGQTAWSQINSATIGGGSVIPSGFCTKFPASDFAVLHRDGNIRIAASGITGAWVGATTNPPSTPAAPFGTGLIYCGGTTWLLSVKASIQGFSKVYRSTDDADNWAETSPGINSLFAGNSAGARCMAFDPEIGRLCIGGGQGTGSPWTEYIIYSDDLGDNWTVATIDKQGIAAEGYIDKIYYAGGGCWVAINRWFDRDKGQTVLVSWDDGENWQIAEVNSAFLSGGDLQSIWCDEKKILIATDNGYTLQSLAG